MLRVPAAELSILCVWLSLSVPSAVLVPETAEFTGLLES